MSAELQARLSDFVTFARQLKGDEKGEAPIYLNALFRAFGHEGTQQAGATHEHRIAKGAGAKGKNFADLFWPLRVLFEMKSRGVKLERHYDQAFDYWTHIVPHRPPYVVLCNFDEFWIYDFNQQLFDPVDKIKLADLPQRWSALAFLLPQAQKPLFENNRVEVTRKAAAQLAQLFRTLVQRGEDRVRAQRFVLQILVSLVSEDLGLLPNSILTRLIKECAQGNTSAASAYDLLGGLFLQMNVQEAARGGRYQSVPYFNGGLFATAAPVELKQADMELLSAASDGDWSKVKPEVFGALFQSSMDDGKDSGRDERHAFGAHFTSEFDIQKVVGPTIVRPWRARIEAARNKMEDLMQVLNELRAFRVLDPACGSGNFLAVAYREMKRLEQDILIRLRDLATHMKVRGSKAVKSVPPEALMSAVSIQQFHGIDVLPFATELAKVTLMVAKELWIIENSQTADSESLFARETPLPLDNLDQNIVCADALFTGWPKADAIIGNPPYLDARKIGLEHGADYVKRIRSKFPGVPGRADLVTYWFKLAHDMLPPAGRAGLVGTNTIRQNNSREGSLDYILANGGTIYDAVATQVWSGDAAVYVSIVNWIKGDHDKLKRLAVQLGDSVDGEWQVYELERISASLSPQLDVTTAVSLKANAKSPCCFEGQQPGHDGFRLTQEECEQLYAQDPFCDELVHPYLNGQEMVTGAWRTQPRYIIDFGERDIFAARMHPEVLKIVRARVLPDWENNAKAENEKTGKESGEHQNRLKTWWQLKRPRQAMQAAIKPLSRYVVCSRVTKRPIFEFIDKHVRPDSSLSVFPLADDYSFGILQSGLHFEWFKARCSTLKGDYRYTSDTVFDSFPWPQAPTAKQMGAVAAAAFDLRDLRYKLMDQMEYSLRDLYRTLDDPGENPVRTAHAKLDAAVRAAYGMPQAADILQFLLDLNLACAAKEKAGEQITPPGLPLPQSEHAAFITADCIKVDMFDGSTDESRALAAHFHSSIAQEVPPVP